MGFIEIIRGVLDKEHKQYSLKPEQISGHCVNFTYNGFIYTGYRVSDLTATALAKEKQEFNPESLISDLNSINNFIAKEGVIKLA